MNLDTFIQHSRNRDYMSGVERDELRVRQTGEIFTPTELVQELLDKIPEEQYTDPTKTFLDPACGDGQFLSEVIIKKMESGSTYKQALDTTFGVDLMQDNIEECITRFYGNKTIDCIKIGDSNFPEEYKEPGLIAVFTYDGKLVPNLVQADGIEYTYNFGRPATPPEHLAPTMFAAKKRKTK